MTAAWIIVLLVVAFISARILRSTKIWWVFLSTIMAGLIVGMLSKEVSNSSKKDNLTSYTQLINSEDLSSIDLNCIQSAYVTEALSYSAVVGYSKDLIEKESKGLINTYLSKTRDSPDYKDSS